MNDNQVLFPEFPWDLKIGRQLIHLKAALNKQLFEEIDGFDFSRMQFTPPLLSAYYSSTISELDQELPFRGLNSYLETIQFPMGLTYEAESDIQQALNRYESKTYLPVTKFFTENSGDYPRIREKVLSHITNSIRAIVKMPTNYYSALSYLISELTDNICEHSTHPFGYLTFQYYPLNAIIDICLVDRGVGILGSYNNYTGDRDFSQITDHMEAVDAAVRGQSTKKVSEERGFGIATSRSMLVNGLKGSFVCLSGNGLLFNEELSNFGTIFNGTLILLRIPVGIYNENFDWPDYVE